MRYLRMLSNSVIAAGLASGFLTALVLQLNPSISIDPATLLPLALVFGVAYGANLTVVFYSLIVMRQILAVEVLSPGWLSVRLLSWLCTIAAGGGAGLMWLNLLGFRRCPRSGHARSDVHRCVERDRGGGDLSWPRALAPGPPRWTNQRRNPVDDDGRIGVGADHRSRARAATARCRLRFHRETKARRPFPAGTCGC